MAAQRPVWTPGRSQQLRALIEEGLGSHAIAAQMGVSRNAVVSQAGELGLSIQHARYSRPRVHASPCPVQEGRTLEELLESKRRMSDRMESHDPMIRVQVDEPGPFGIAFVGDPHIDDDGFDLNLWERHAAIFNRNPGVIFPTCVGDYTNNWVGRLARLYANQSTSAVEAWKLAKWFIESVDWLLLVGGNHDAWSGSADPIAWMAAQAGVVYRMNGARVQFELANGSSFVVNTRHDHKGSSQWNDVHGEMKAAKMGFQDDVYVAGHLHRYGSSQFLSPDGKRLQLAMKVGTYKRYDSHADTLGFAERFPTPCVGITVRPDEAGNPWRYILPAFTLEQLEDDVLAARYQAGCL